MKAIDRRLSMLVGTAALLVGLVGCSTAPTSTWDPGAPDALTAEHYSLVLAAIDKKAKQDAQAALYLLRADVMRMRTNAVEMQLALSRLYAVTNAVDKEDWTAARSGIQTLRTNYGRPDMK
jgi:methylthioribose-1-phosphate isomerase